ncbi:flagellar export protein FliJ [Clostridium vincentii]|uniref:Flagellar FliJ protein n=1 Tax=Clostridium vincentii TaxID=52704 RepID=A0A2T0B6B4_9CLOT|nr:flagellar export protein FliJ [Clostridium vincentii]PRR79431.1 flagellar biosynthesis chaperone [Clostridium vincentii]
MTQKYKFRLQKLLELREEKEEESKRLFSESQSNKIKTQNDLEELKDKYESYRGIKPGEDIIYQKVKRNYLYAIDAGIKDKEKELVLRGRELEKRRMDLKEKQIDRKTVATLKDKQYNSYVKEQDRLEVIDIDEIALYAYMKNMKGGE